MKLRIFTLVTLFAGLSFYHSQTSVNASGDNAQSVSGNVSYSVGQVFYETVSSSIGSLVPGVQQSYEISTELGTDISSISINLSIYPNPSTDFLNLKIDFKDYNQYTYELYDYSGKILDKRVVGSAVVSIKMNTYPAATYLLKVLKSNKPVKIFKVIKKDN